MRALRGLLLGQLLGVLAWAACSSGGGLCQSSCSGCCDLNNACQPGTEANACGTNALQCQRCTPGTCVDHACVAADGGVGGGSATGGGSSTGGGDATGGGAATGGGTATGGGSAVGGGAATGGGTGGGGAVVIFDPDAGIVPLTFGLCSPMQLCGGNPLGVWAYTSDCINDGDLQNMVQKSVLVCDPMFGSAVTVSNQRGWVQGWAGFDGTNVRHVVHGHFAFSADLLGVCETQCANMPGFLSGEGLNAICLEDAGSCTCDIDGGLEFDQSTTYIFSGHTLTFATGARTWDFCAANKLLLHETTMSGAEPGYPQAKKQ